MDTINFNVRWNGPTSWGAFGAEPYKVTGVAYFFGNIDSGVVTLIKNIPTNTDLPFSLQWGDGWAELSKNFTDTISNIKNLAIYIQFNSGKAVRNLKFSNIKIPSGCRNLRLTITANDEGKLFTVQFTPRKEDAELLN